MSWTAPAVDRSDPPFTAGERAQLDAWLDYHRRTLLQKCAGLSADQLKVRAVEPSTLSLLGLVRHMAEVERSWFRTRFLGEDVPFLFIPDVMSDADFDEVDTADAAGDIAVYEREIAEIRAAIAGHQLDETFIHPRIGEEISLRWVYLHLIEEYARHNGHADLLRERIDGATGM
jgi:uncharacterized damage-inducible protein DinB